MRALLTAACAFLIVACGEAPRDAPDATVTRTASGASDGGGESPTLEAGGTAPGPPRTDGLVETGRPSDAASTVEAGRAERGCLPDMISVDATYCPDVERHCLDVEHDEINNIDICHAFAHGERCRRHPRRIAFCIDRYEYPNRKGAHPTWMVDWYQAQATCESVGKRLCYASEWTAACEGPDHRPFPYGWERDHTKCNIDNFFIEPKKWAPKGQFLFYSRDPAIALPELSRLDQSVPSGSMDGCESGYGAVDMTGNLDEWVVSDVAPREKSLWAGLKGGAWGHVRSQCRPMTYSHDPGFSYYFVGFRCCSDAEGAPRWTPSAQAMRPPVVESHDYASEAVVVVDPAGPSKYKFSRSGHAQ